MGECKENGDILIYGNIKPLFTATYNDILINPTIEVPWADAYERMSLLLEKKDG